MVPVLLPDLGDQAGLRDLWVRKVRLNLEDLADLAGPGDQVDRVGPDKAVSVVPADTVWMGLDKSVFLGSMDFQN